MQKDSLQSRKGRGKEQEVETEEGKKREDIRNMKEKNYGFFFVFHPLITSKQIRNSNLVLKVVPM